MHAYEGSFISQIQSLSVNAASYSAPRLLSQRLSNVTNIQIQISHDAALLLRFLTLNPQITVFSIQHTQPHVSRVDGWGTFTTQLGAALHCLPDLEALRIDIDDEDLTASFIRILSTLPHTSKNSPLAISTKKSYPDRSHAGQPVQVQVHTFQHSSTLSSTSRDTSTSTRAARMRGRSLTS